MIRIQPIVPDEAASRSWWESIVNQVAADVPMAWELLYRSLFPLRFEIVAKIGRLDAKKRTKASFAGRA